MCKTFNISVSENEFSDDSELTLFLSFSPSSSVLSSPVCFSNANCPSLLPETYRQVQSNMREMGARL